MEYNVTLYLLPFFAFDYLVNNVDYLVNNVDYLVNFRFNTDYLNIKPFFQMQNFPRLCCDIFLSMKSGPKHRLFNWLEFFDHLIFVFKEKSVRCLFPWK